MLSVTEAISGRLPFDFGELRVRFEGEVPIVEGPPSATGDVVAVLPGDAWEWARTDGQGRYRPLPGMRTLRQGWLVRCRDEEELRAVLDDVYPLALRHMELWERGNLLTVPLQAVLARQSGRYEAAVRLSESGRAAAGTVLCERCVKTPIWHEGAVAQGEIPCPEPCSVLVSLCREGALWEAEPPAPAAIDPGIAFGRFDCPGNEIREAWLAARFGTTASQQAH